MSGVELERMLNGLRGGYSEAALSAAFDRVKNPEHWKGPIDWTGPLTPAEITLTRFAVTFYTATEPTITRTGHGVYRVTAPGYWAGPAN